MASFSCPSPYPVRCSANTQGHDTNKPKLNNIKINGTSSSSAAWSRTKIDNNNNVSSGVSATMTSVAPITENENIIPKEQLRQNIPTKKQFVDSHRQGLIIEGGVGYRQTVVIRSYEVGPDKTTTIESILNLLQAIPDHVLESQQLSGIIMEYRRECGSSDIVESLCEADDDGILEEGVLLEHGTHINNLLNGFMKGNGLLGSFSNKAPQKFTHLLQINGNNENKKKEELVRGKTIWKQKVSCMPFPHS